MTSLRESRFHDLLPPNLRTPHTTALSAAFDRQMRELVDYIPVVYALALVEEMGETMCDQVALGYNIPEYKTSLSLEAKRELIRFAFQINARKGTAWAVDRLVTTVFGSAKTEEWFGYDGDPYFFRIRTSNPLPGPDDLTGFLSAIQKTKNVRSWLEAIILELQARTGAYAGVAVHDAAVETSRLTGDVMDPSPPPWSAWAGFVYQEVSDETSRLTGDAASVCPPPWSLYGGFAYHDASIETTIFT